MLFLIKRNLIALFVTLKALISLAKKQYANCMLIIAKMEFLNCFVARNSSRMLFSLLAHKYDPAALNSSDPYLLSVRQRFSIAYQQYFMMGNIIVIKPYVSPDEKGVILLNYTEVINAFPFLFELKKVQDRYHIVLEPSTESPYQLYLKFYYNSSFVFTQSLSEREKKQVEYHGYVPVPLCAGDWVDERNFMYDAALPIQYDFCVIANFISVKRYPFLLASIQKYWSGPLKFAIVASARGGEKKDWIDQLLKEYGLTDSADIFLDIPQPEVAKILNSSCCHVLTSLREGANRANFESLFINTPVVVYEHHIGFPNYRFGYPSVVTYTDGKTLVSAIKQCREIKKNRLLEKNARMVGSEIATRSLNETIKKYTIAHNGKWTKDLLRKINRVHTYYFNPADTQQCIEDYQYLADSIKDKSMYDVNWVYGRYFERNS